MLYGFFNRVSPSVSLRESLDASTQRTRIIADRVAKATLQNQDGFAIPEVGMRLSWRYLQEDGEEVVGMGRAKLYELRRLPDDLHALAETALDLLAVVPRAREHDLKRLLGLHGLRRLLDDLDDDRLLGRLAAGLDREHEPVAAGLRDVLDR